MTTIKKYNTDTSQWETIAVGRKGDTGEGVPAGGSAGQVLAKASGTAYDTEWVNQYKGQEVRHDWSSPNSYMGVAEIGSSESSEVWKITKITISGSTITTAVASAVRWDDRLTASYT